MQEWICSLGPYWGSAVGAIAILLGIAIGVGAIMGVAALILWICGKIADRWNDAKLPTIQVSFETKEKIKMVFAVIFLVAVGLGVISLFIYGGFNMWKNACSGLGLI